MLLFALIVNFIFAVYVIIFDNFVNSAENLVIIDIDFAVNKFIDYVAVNYTVMIGVEVSEGVVSYKFYLFIHVDMKAEDKMFVEEFVVLAVIWNEVGSNIFVIVFDGLHEILVQVKHVDFDEFLSCLEYCYIPLF